MKVLSLIGIVVGLVMVVSGPVGPRELSDRVTHEVRGGVDCTMGCTELYGHWCGADVYMGYDEESAIYVFADPPSAGHIWPVWGEKVRHGFIDEYAKQCPPSTYPHSKLNIDEAPVIYGGEKVQKYECTDT